MTRRPRTVGGTGRPALAPLPVLLLVDPDEDARAMIRDALVEGARPCTLRTVAATAELADYLAQRGEHADPVTAPAPALALVDLDLPGDDGLAAIRALKRDRARVPVVALTRRPETDRVAGAYDAGANTVLPRPVTFLALVRLMKVFTAYWLDAAVLPREGAA